MSYDWEERAFPSIVNKYFDDKNDMHLDQEFGDRELAAKDKPFQNHSNTTLFCPNCFLK